MFDEQQQISQRAYQTGLPFNTFSGTRFPVFDHNLLWAPRTIEIREQNHTEASMIQDRFCLSPLISRVMSARGHKADHSFELFLNQTVATVTNPETIKDYIQTVKQITDAIQKNIPITFFGDYDADGNTSLVQWKFAIEALKAQYQSTSRIHFQIPHRIKDGFGLCDRLIDDNPLRDTPGLVVISDFGTQNRSEIERLTKELGNKVCVVDHHLVHGATLPNALIVNPAQENCGYEQNVLCASGLVNQIVSGLGVQSERGLAFAAVGTIADVVPLIGPSRAIAREGLAHIQAGVSPVLTAMLHAANVNTDTITAQHVAFLLGPMINAVGRLGDSNWLIKSLTTDAQSEAEATAQELLQITQRLWTESP